MADDAGSECSKNDLADNEQDDYADLGTVEFLSDIGMIDFFSEEQKKIKQILSLKNTTWDKVTYMIFSLNIFITCFLVGHRPNYFYLWHSVKAVILLSYRWYAYKRTRNHYYFFDFCYFTNFLILLYLWLPNWILGPAVRGWLFTVCFCFANGPVLVAIVAWRNSLVPHSTDKMTSLFIHISPCLTLYGLRWFSIPDQGFSVCSGQHDFDVTTCHDVPTSEILYSPLLMYCVWQFFYLLTVDYLFKERIEKRDYETSYKYLVTKSKNSFFIKLFGMFGPTYCKPVFIAWQFIYTLMSLGVAYLCYMCIEVNVAATVIVMGCASYNGASFYIDVFSHKYNLKSN